MLKANGVDVNPFGDASVAVVVLVCVIVVCVSKAGATPAGVGLRK